MDGRDDQIRGVLLDERTRRLTCNGPHRGCKSTSPRPPVGGVEAGAPQMRRLDHVWVHFRSAIKWTRRVVLEEIHHLSSHLIRIFEMDGFDDGFRRGAMSAARVGEVKDDVWFFRNWKVHLYARSGWL